MGNGEGRAQSKALFITVYPWEQLTRKGELYCTSEWLKYSLNGRSRKFTLNWTPSKCSYELIYHLANLSTWKECYFSIVFFFSLPSLRGKMLNVRERCTSVVDERYIHVTGALRTNRRNWAHSPSLLLKTNGQITRNIPLGLCCSQCLLCTNNINKSIIF